MSPVNSQPKLFSWRQLLIVTLSLVVITSLTVFIASRMLHSWKEKLSAMSQPNQRLETTHGILYLLADAENFAREYSLTQEPMSMVHYRDNIQSLRESVDQLNPLYAEDSTDRALVDSLHQLIEFKIALFDSFIVHNSDEALKDSLMKQVDVASNDSALPQTVIVGKPQAPNMGSKESQPTSGKNKFGDLFKKKNRKRPSSNSDQQKPVHGNHQSTYAVKSDYEKVFSNLEEQQQRLIEMQSTQELLWLEQDYHLTALIISFIQTLEKGEQVHAEITATSAALVANKLFFIITISFAALAVALLTLIGMLWMRLKKE